MTETITVTRIVPPSLFVVSSLVEKKGQTKPGELFSYHFDCSTIFKKFFDK